MNLEQFHKSDCQKFLHRKMNRESANYIEPVIVSRQEVINAICKQALITSQLDDGYRGSVDINILSAVDGIISQYSEYKLTEATIKRLGELVGFKQTEWSDLLKI